MTRTNSELMDLLRLLVEDFDPFDYEQGRCYWCDGGWEQVPGRNGGKGRYEHTRSHRDGCPFAAAQAALWAEVRA